VLPGLLSLEPIQNIKQQIYPGQIIKIMLQMPFADNLLKPALVFERKDYEKN